MDINLLRTFLEVHRTCHFGKAAENLFVTQSTVSARIRQLEDELGVKLFSRDRNNIQLTAAGQKFLRHAESILNVWNRARMDIHFLEEGKRPFVIGAIPSLWDVYLPDILTALKKQFPDLPIVAEAITTDNLIRQLYDQSIDLGFTYDYPQVTDLVISDFKSFELIMVSSRKSTTLEKALKKNYIYVNWGTSYANEHASHFPELKPDMKLGIGHVALEYIKRNGGSAYLPEPTVRQELGHTLYRVEGAPAINRKSFAVYLEGSNHAGVVKSLLSLCSH